MLTLVPLLVVVLVGVLLAAGRRQTSPGAPSQRPGSRLGVVLQRAVDAGAITAEQRTAVLSMERARPAATARGSIPPVAEALGYLGAALALAGVASIVGQYWEELASWARLLLVGGAAVVLGVVGWLVRDDDPLRWRLRSVLWLLSALAVAGTAAIVAVDVLGWVNEPVAISIGLATAGYSAALWRRQDLPAQQLTTVAGLVTAAVGTMALVDGLVAVGLALLALGGTWLALGWRGLLPPLLASLLLGGVVLLAGPAVLGAAWPVAGPLVGLVLAVALVWLGTDRQQFVLTGLGATGVFAYLPWSLTELFGETVGVPVVLVVSGLLLLAVMIVLLQRRDGSRPGPLGGRGHHPLLH